LIADDPSVVVGSFEKSKNLVKADCLMGERTTSNAARLGPYINEFSIAAFRNERKEMFGHEEGSLHSKVS
jgi:hypothetical protein